MAGQPTPTDVERMLGYVWKIVRQHFNGVPVDVAEPADLVQAGMVAVIRAAQRWRPDGGASFRTYATPRIHGEIVDYLRKLIPGGRNHIGEYSVSSLDATLYHLPDGQPVTGLDVLESQAATDDYAELETAELEAALWHAVDELPDRERHAIVLTFHAGLTQEQAGQCMGVSNSRVSQLVSAGCRRLADRQDVRDLADAA